MVEDRKERERFGFHFWMLAGFLAIIVLMGGSNRQDVWQLLLLRPLSVIVLAVGLYGITRDQLHFIRYPLFLLLAIAAVASVQLIPLPPSLEKALPGRALIAHARDLAGVGGAWQPISLVPSSTLLFLMGLTVPLAVLVCAVRCTAGERQWLVLGAISVGIVSAILGLCQLMGPPDNFLYFYRISNFGMAVGIFANRNHQALYLASMLPLLAASLILLMRARGGWAMLRLVLFASAFLIVAMLLIVGSRAGLIASAVAVAGIPFALPRKSFKSLIVLWGAAIAAIIVLVGTFALISRAPAVERLLATRTEDELRAQSFQPILRRTESLFPIGAGFGTFPEVYRIQEPTNLLRPTYLNRAHNDVLEIIFEAGAAGVALALAAVGLWAGLAWRAYKDSRKSHGGRHLAVSALVLLLILGIGSVGDYPLRTPILQALAMLAILWAKSPQSDWVAATRRRSSPLERSSYGLQLNFLKVRSSESDLRNRSRPRRSKYKVIEGSRPND